METGNNISYLLNHSPAVRLLCSRQRDLILTFLDRTFKTSDRPSVTEDSLLLTLSDYIEYKSIQEDDEYEITASDSYEEKAKKYLKKWTSDGYLNFFPDESGDRYYELSSHSEKVLQWLGSLEKKEFIGTESRFKDIFVKLKELVEYSNEDREKRIEELGKRKLDIEKQISNLKKGEEVAVFDAYQIKSRINELNQSAKELLSDFKEVEENFKTITKEIYKKHTDPDLSKGNILEFTFDALNELQSSEQGKSFYAFWEFLLTKSRQNEWAKLTSELFNILAKKEIDFNDPFLKKMKRHLHASGKKVYEANDKMAEKISRIIGERELEDRIKIKEVIGNIKSSLLKIEEHGIYPPVESTIEENPLINMPLERKLTLEESVTTDFNGNPQQAEEKLSYSDDLVKVFSQFYVNKKELRNRVRKALMNKSQVTLSEVIETSGGIEKGLAEVFGYFSILDDFQNIKDDSQTCDILFDKESRKIIEIPEVIISR